MRPSSKADRRNNQTYTRTGCVRYFKFKDSNLLQAAEEDHSQASSPSCCNVRHQKNLKKKRQLLRLPSPFSLGRLGRLDRAARLGEARPTALRGSSTTREGRRSKHLARRGHRGGDAVHLGGFQRTSGWRKGKEALTCGECFRGCLDLRRLAMKRLPPLKSERNYRSALSWVGDQERPRKCCR